MSDKKDKRARHIELLSPNSKNFLGTGMTLDEFSALMTAEKLAASWCLQSRDECKRRRRAVILLSQELGRIEEKTMSATRNCELAIEAVIEGDWKMVEEWAEHFTFAEEFPKNVTDEAGTNLRDKYVPVFVTFRELLLQVLRTDKEPPA